MGRGLPRLVWGQTAAARGAAGGTSVHHPFLFPAALFCWPGYGAQNEREPRDCRAAFTLLTFLALRGKGKCNNWLGTDGTPAEEA